MSSEIVRWTIRRSSARRPSETLGRLPEKVDDQQDEGEAHAALHDPVADLNDLIVSGRACQSANIFLSPMSWLRITSEP